MKTISKRMVFIILVLSTVGMWSIAHASRVSNCQQAEKTVSFRHDVLPALQSKCMPCHFSSEIPPGLTVSSEKAYSNLVGRASVEVPGEDIVKPGDAAHSYLVRKLMARPGVGERMPPYGAPLSPSEQKLLREWIAQGAKNN